MRVEVLRARADSHHRQRRDDCCRRNSKTSARRDGRLRLRRGSEYAAGGKQQEVSGEEMAELRTGHTSQGGQFPSIRRRSRAELTNATLPQVLGAAWGGHTTST